MSKKQPYTTESVERALEVHESEGRILAWSRVEQDGKRSWIVKLNAFPGYLTLTSLREAYILVLGVASAALAKREAEK